ncbi:UNVERIFIED_CONTAM: Bifunctional bis(5'-adenosyl)-triphosphatase/adenylylsulfatase FHIT [Sesamum calycinum]|uniref:Bifunctional bis(5'-adenosyl)-triphosphatase/adenylylsulfatase FHIT n=1 Tax=Sesamum calycinum TaxID=2727403 RepID=A0AAW2SF92_9LAMI
MESESYTFGPYKIGAKEVFYSTQLSYALVNLRPVVPVSYAAVCNSVLEWWVLGENGKKQKLKETSLFDVFEKLFCTSTRPRLVSSNNVLIVGCVCSLLQRFIDLTADETSDLWLTAQKIGHQLESYHNASSLTFTIQDGPKAGQTVPHVHIHILPRKSGDFENNDEIYEAEKELKQKLDLDKERKDRSMEEMAEEAAEYRKLFS